MHIFPRLFTLAAAVSLCGKAFSVPMLRFVPVSPGTVNDIIITAENTINATAPPPESGLHSLSTLVATPSNARLPLALVNNFPGGNINAYVTGLDSQGRLVMLTPDGNFFYPSGTPGQPIPQSINANVAIPLGPRGSTTSITIPDYISSARIWFAAGNIHFYRSKRKYQLGLRRTDQQRVRWSVRQPLICRLRRPRPRHVNGSRRRQHPNRPRPPCECSPSRLPTTSRPNQQRRPTMG